MRIAACITTRNRSQQLDYCLKALWNSTVKPHTVVVSDDSQDIEVQQANQEVVKRYPGTTYITGPKRGVCANRNNAVNATSALETDFVAFVDDDICVEPNFIANAVNRYSQIPSDQRKYTILTGASTGTQGERLLPSKLSFRGYFCATEGTPETVVIHAALFPRQFFSQEQWDEDIFFGYEDAELCLRAIKHGYKIVSCPELQVNIKSTESVLDAPGIGRVSNYELHIEAARLYIGIKRYKNLFPNPMKLLAFLAIYFVHMSGYLLKRGAIQAWPEIIRRSRINLLWQQKNIAPTEAVSSAMIS
ncbi:putative glycosyltransferase [Rivularia sp. PCC 7116]|uniref:glycosyltransferase family 2 protein n=1 Tax=Rivularia sp. PCC 7116 TaxID=373994 RepID=UPI00029EDE16|nr:glycosyltransferase [Rivularia sp. PCC 7116]AFY56665.1 putative glycosyltransferase [Rivularia sp. PCC 7116]